MRQMWVVGIGGFIGTLLRTGVSFLFPFILFPWGTLIVNVTGSFLLGFLFALCTRFPRLKKWRLGLGTGLLGSYTTFSAWSAEMSQLESIPLQLIYLIVTFIGGPLFAWWGDHLGTRGYSH
ncbi:fluoride efflux transporter FluC [Hazenella coriacea]|uniref:Fluoride-specific ion channel FluC n=1 Tax=Hazenella coriacea TaxID=1179467 RepID=A0A4R3L2C5_9BACL|nr:CrcB family protein [Hazenella coriacea]TCS92841.1 CrcB protein [Hazenella coriacea]